MKFSIIAIFLLSLIGCGSASEEFNLKFQNDTESVIKNITVNYESVKFPIEGLVLAPMKGKEMKPARGKKPKSINISWDGKDGKKNSTSVAVPAGDEKNVKIVFSNDGVKALVE